MEWLRRNAAPLSQKTWKEIDDIADSMFKQTVVARRIADFDGPRGWNHLGTQLGTFKAAAAPKIADMAPGYFWAHISSLGECGSSEELALRFRTAEQRLLAVEPAGVKEWMTTRRAMC